MGGEFGYSGVTTETLFDVLFDDGFEVSRISGCDFLGRNFLRCRIDLMGEAQVDPLGRDLWAAEVAYIGLFTFKRQGKSLRHERRLLTFGGAYSGMLVSGVDCTWGSGAGGSWTCTG
jgi:hypothetical protein